MKSGLWVILCLLLLAAPKDSFAKTHAKTKNPFIKKVAEPDISKCKPLLKKYESAKAAIKKLLQSETDPKEVEPALTTFIQAVKTISTCLPTIEKHSSGGYEFQVSIADTGGCEDEAENWKNDDLYGCLGRWDFIAHQRYQLELPADDCQLLLKPFFEKKETFHACYENNNPGKPKPGLKAKF